MSNPAWPKGGKLPNGKVTKSDNVYVKEWRKFGKCIALALNLSGQGKNWYAYGYDPGISLNEIRSVDGYWLRRMELNITEARALAFFGGWKG